MARYLITTPNKQFNEKVMGIQFSNGRATVDEYTIDHSLGYTEEEIARRMKTDFGYEVEQIGGLGQAVPDVILGLNPPVMYDIDPSISTKRAKKK